MSLLGCLDLPESPFEQAVDSLYHFSILIHLFERSIQSPEVISNYINMLISVLHFVFFKKIMIGSLKKEVVVRSY